MTVNCGLAILTMLITSVLCASSMLICSNQQAKESSLFKITCCERSNSGKVLKLDGKKTLKLFFCPKNQAKLCSFKSCEDILNRDSTADSGYYHILSTDGSMKEVYCDMEGLNCDNEGGWTRIAYLNMTQPGATCPTALTSKSYSNLNHILCGKEGIGGGCSSVYYTTPIKYTKVCGQVRGYQYWETDGLAPIYEHINRTINDIYVDGVSITYGTDIRQHLWTYAAGRKENGAKISNCPCNRGFNMDQYPQPSFVGEDYYCESGNPDVATEKLYNDVLWDGLQCRQSEDTCCMNSAMPWFMKTLSNEEMSSIEVRICLTGNDEDIPLEVIEIYVK